MLTHTIAAKTSHEARNRLATAITLTFAGSLLVACSGGQPDELSTPPIEPTSAGTSSGPTPTRTPTGTLDSNASSGPGDASPVVPTSNPDEATATPTRAPLPPGRAGTPRGAKSSLKEIPEATGPDRVSLAFALNLELWDTTIDNRPNDASARASAYATPELRKQLLAGAPVAPPGAAWDRLVKHDGYTTATAELGGIGAPPPDTETTALRAVTITKHTFHGEDGWSTPGPNQGNLYILELTLIEDVWAVSGYKLQ